MTLLAAAQFITESLRLDRPPPAGLDRQLDWPQLLSHADAHSLTPLLYAVWREAGLLAHLPDEVGRRMARAYEDNGQRNGYIRDELVEIHDILSRAGVPHLVLKGWPLLERLYTGPAHRVLYDHDFLVPPDRAERGQQALLAVGFRPLPGKDEWVEKHLPPVWRHEGYVWDGYLFDPHYPRPVELHRNLWEQGWRGLRVGRLAGVWSRAQTRSVAGTPMQILSDEDTVIHLAMHFAGHLVEREARLNQLLDLARLVQQSPNLDWAAVRDRAVQAGVGRFVYASLFLAHQVFGASLPPPPVWADLAAATPVAFQAWLFQAGVTDVLTGDYRQRDRGQDYELTFRAAASRTEKVGIIRFALFPPLGHLAAKYKLSDRRLGALFYPYYLVERLADYSRSWLRSRQRDSEDDPFFTTS